MNITIKDREIYVNVQFGKRKNITMEITPEGLVTVKAPTKTPEADITAFLLKNAKQLTTFFDRLENRTYVKRQKDYTLTENFLYLGKTCSISELIEEIPEDEEAIQVLLKRFYTQKTREIVKERVKHYETVMNVKSKSVTVVDTAGTWGTCNSRRELTFNYRLSMAPIPVIDSVVIHELCHLMHLNHDRSFWRKVGTYDENYKQHQDYLDRFGYVMTI